MPWDLANDSSRQIVDKLREIFLDKFIQLPAIVVAGDTSSGKSSLLTAISTLQFPSSSGLTTRCPTEVILTRSPQKHVVVTLRLLNEAKDDRQGDPTISEQRSFRRELSADWSDFADIISEATELLTRGHGSNYITPNAIVIKVKGPELPDLTLIDLPGLVAACGQDESDAIIKEIHSMITGYMRSSRAVILCVLPANNDFHNSAILTMAKACDPTGCRTLGIVTKPDIVDRGSEDDVIELMNNKRAWLELGWHIVKLRSQNDLKAKTCQAAEAEEAHFFDTKP